MCVFVYVFIEKTNKINKIQKNPVDSLSADFLHVLSNCVSFQYLVFCFLIKVKITNF